ncbi:MAG: zinc-ribbon domain-containing protein, partial [Hasllibacter sp.]
MRLSCPNCDAVYEVPADAVPPEGRDVQCTNCGHLWFQEAGADADAEALAADDWEIDPEEGWSTDAPVPPAGSAYGPGGRALTGSEDAFDEDDGFGHDDPPPAPPPGPAPSAEASPGRGDAPPRAPRDMADLDLLREEAERERRARAAERAAAAPIETQADLDLSDPPPLPVAPAPIPEAEPPVGGPAADADRRDDRAPSRRSAGEALPDVDEINSSLRPAAPDRGEDGEPAARWRP